MIEKPTVMDEAIMKQEFHRLYKEIGFVGCQQVLFEILKSAEWLSEIMLEGVEDNENH